jgi:hypothetical protein
VVCAAGPPGTSRTAGSVVDVVVLPGTDVVPPSDVVVVVMVELVVVPERLRYRAARKLGTLLAARV